MKLGHSVVWCSAHRGSRLRWEHRRKHVAPAVARIRRV